MVVHQDTFDAVAAVQPPKVFDRAVHCGNLFSLHRGDGQQEMFRERGAQGLGQVGHLLKGGNRLVQPLENLACSERLFTERGQLAAQFFDCQAFDFGHRCSWIYIIV